jgi:hypothetical protein
MRVTNNLDIGLAIAVWLLHDEYDYVTDVENYISVTTLMKPLRQIVLPHRIPTEQRTSDVSEFIARKFGHAIHDSVEKAWVKGHERSMRLLGYPQDIIDRVAINPTDEQVRASNEIIPVYLEQREIREHNGFSIGGKFDMVADGIVQDFKSTSVWGWIKDDKNANYQLQMSLYRWLDAGRSLRRIQEDFGRINFVFTDWSKAQMRTTPNYPPKRVEHKDIPLMSLAETEQWVENKLALIKRHWNTPEDQLPHCTDEELWRSAPQFKYFSDPAKASLENRSTKNFDDMASARAFMAEKGGKGAILTVPGEVKACGYCPAFDGCTQKDIYFPNLKDNL